MLDVIDDDLALMRRDTEAGCDIAALLGQPAEAIGISPHLVDMQIGLGMQRADQRRHAVEHRREISGLLVLGVGAFADMDVDPIAGKPLLGQRGAAGEPVRRIGLRNDDGGDLGVLAQDLCRQRGDGLGNLPLQRKGAALAGIDDGDQGHGGLSVQGGNAAVAPRT